MLKMRGSLGVPPSGGLLFIEDRLKAELPTYRTPAMPVSIGWVTNSRGSVTCPVRALAATVSGEARYTADLVLPMRPGKLRLVVLMQTSVLLRRPKVSAGPPRHALQPDGPTRQPASMRMSSML